MVDRRARSVAELRSAGVDIRSALFIDEESPQAVAHFQIVLTILDPEIALTVACVENGTKGLARQIQKQSERLGRQVNVLSMAHTGGEVLQQVRASNVEAVVLFVDEGRHSGQDLHLDGWRKTVVELARCRVVLLAEPPVPDEVSAV